MVASAAVTKAVEAVEGRFLKSVINESYFSLDALFFRALDAETMRRLQEILDSHESYREGFRASFLREVVQSEYRSNRGSTVIPAPDLCPEVELAQTSLDQPTADESYLLTLKGRRSRFEATAVIGGPWPRSARPSLAEKGPPSSGLLRSTAESGASVALRVHDRGGDRSFEVPLPLVIGRVQAGTGSGSRDARVDIDATYISRRQLMVFELMGQVYMFVPSEASLTCRSDQFGTMQRDRIYRLPSRGSVSLIAGIPEGDKSGVHPSEDPSDYPRMTVALSTVSEPEEGTPRPRAVG
jgi:hypothetical protein